MKSIYRQHTMKWHSVVECEYHGTQAKALSYSNKETARRDQDVSKQRS